MTPTCPVVRRAEERGIALLAVLFALTLLALLALPFAVSMGVGADAAVRTVEATQVEQASASVRDLLLADVALSHPAFDEDPAFDTLAEFPASVQLPAAFDALREQGRVLLGGAVWDLQRYLALDAVTPLVLANLLGGAGRLAEDLLPDSTAIVLTDAGALPDSGFVWIDHEVIRYGSKRDNQLVDLERGQFRHLGFIEQENPVAATALVLDHRCVLAAAWPFLGRGDAARRTRRPFVAAGELAEIVAAGCGSFSPGEIDRFAAALSPQTLAANAATWGRPERVFDAMIPAVSRSLRVKSALHVGAGSTVRLRDLSTGTVEYALVMRAGTERSVTDLLLPSVFRLELLLPVVHAFPAGDTVIEPLIPPPVNVNTASATVLAAVFADVRRAFDVRVHEADGRQRSAPPLPIGRGQAMELARQIVALRDGDVRVPGQGPFRDWKDLVDRSFAPRFDGAGDAAKWPWVYLYRNLRTGRDSAIEMGTAPICFESGPWVGFRAAASRSRSTVAAGVAARHERSGLAAVVPGFRIERTWNTQQLLEEAFRLDRRAPFWTTTPENTGAVQPGEIGNDPAGRYFPHIIPVAFPGLGLGAARYGSNDTADAAIRPAPAAARTGRYEGVQVQEYDSFAQTNDPRGHDVNREGAYRIVNSGPRGGGSGGQGGAGGRTRSHDRIWFPFSTDQGFMARFGAGFWAEPQSLESVVLFDHGGGDAERNRLSLQGRDGELVLEVIDEAGLDPDPSQSPAGVERTAGEWSVPIAELGLPADTPVHVNVSAFSNRPSDLSLFVDGVVRGKPKFSTFLTAALPAFDPSLANNQQFPPQGTNDKYLDIQVESTDGFPPVGVLRIGTELFEYTGISGNTFQCQWRDSHGGRGARQAAREHRPDVPVDANGRPTVDIDSLRQQGVNLDVFPEHPAGSMVELYGYSALVSEDSPTMPGTTALDGTVGGFAVGRGFVQSPRPIAITLPRFPPIPIGEGIDETWTGDLELADPLPDARGAGHPPAAARAAISDAFPTGGGYALLVQYQSSFEPDVPGQVGGVGVAVGGVELVRYTSRQGNKLRDIQRAQRLPGNDNQIDRTQFDGSARKFVTNWRLTLADGRTSWNEVPTRILWVVPVSLPLQNVSAVFDPVATGLTEWVQILPRGDVNDTEWVRYDAVVDNRHIVRGNRAAWESTRFTLTFSTGGGLVRVGPLGPTQQENAILTPPWGTVTPTSGYIGYIPQLEADFPQIQAARRSLNFRGDGLSRTSSHPQTNATVMQCQRMQLPWGNFGAKTGRFGRHDRVAVVQGSVASGETRPSVEWLTVNWVARRFQSDNLSENRNPPERLGPWPFQLVAFTEGMRGTYLGPPQGTVVLDPRQYDRIVKFPSGELPAAWCEEVHVGSAVGGGSPLRGFVDEVEVVRHEALDLVLEDPLDEGGREFRVKADMTFNAAGPLYLRADVGATLPSAGGLVAIDGEVLAYQARADGLFTIAANGRGLLGTEARTHDRGARVRFLTHRAAAILSSGVGPRDDRLALTSLGPLPPRYGAARLGGEVLHYTWVRIAGSEASLEMPRWFPPGAHGDTSSARGLFRGRFGTTPQGASSGEAVIHWPIRYWDRHAVASDDPELAYFQLTTNEAPTFVRGVRWREETSDPLVDVICTVRTDPRVGWDAEPGRGLLLLRRGSGDDDWSRVGGQTGRFELRFATIYEAGAIDLATYTAHAWKTTARIDQIRVDCEGQTRILDEQVTAR